MGVAVTRDVFESGGQGMFGHGANHMHRAFGVVATRTSTTRMARTMTTAVAAERITGHIHEESGMEASTATVVGE